MRTAALVLIFLALTSIATGIYEIAGALRDVASAVRSR